MTDRVRTLGRSRMLGGLVALVVVLQAMIGLFALWYSHAGEHESRQRLGAYTRSLDALRGAQASFGLQVQEWKNILLRDRDAALSERHRAGLRAAADSVSSHLSEALRGAGVTERDIAELRAAQVMLVRRYEAALRDADLTTLEGQARADAMVRGADRALQQALDQQAERLGAAHRTEAASAAAAAEHRYAHLRLTLFICAGIGLVLTVLLMLARGKA
ncbi:hypothetical protein [Roseococcus sp. YIM B11640]|uniref:hypothetical protein n=1 Tax=Roseococcus sp. YIM B11640 TaxID=3133973 RepID=UPI003C7B8B8D